MSIGCGVHVIGERGCGRESDKAHRNQEDSGNQGQKVKKLF